jgi:prepilin-type processing-associated H-X9-DG protein
MRTEMARYGLKRRAALTLTELLVILAVFGVVVGLLVPAMQKSRESANLARCTNNLRQLGLAVHQHHDVYGYLPSAGWGSNWVGIADRGTGPNQPGGWAYQALPFLEQLGLHDLDRNLAGTAQEMAIAGRLGTPVPAFYCPTRRSPQAYASYQRTYHLSALVAAVVRSDYAANYGDTQTEFLGGPSTLAEGDDPTYAWPDRAGLTGVVFLRSAIRFADISNGTSSTFLLGEKYLNPQRYVDGRDEGDNDNAFVGFDNDVVRSTSEAPKRDLAGESNASRFGSPHASGVNMLYCDGSVQHLSYHIAPAVFARAGNRK